MIEVAFSIPYWVIYIIAIYSLLGVVNTGLELYYKYLRHKTDKMHKKYANQRRGKKE